MSKNIENTKIEKLPTSQLIFYITSPELSDERLKLKTQETVFGRLTKRYKLYPDRARIFFEREKEVIGVRGHDIERYSFGKDMPYDKLFRIFYDSAELASGVFKLKDNFNTLTMSEMVEFYAWVTIYKRRFEDRQKMFQKDFKNNDNGQKKILNSNGIPFDIKEQKINELREHREIIQLQDTNERTLIGYNEMLSECIFKKIKKVMGYDISQDLRAYWTFAKEGCLLNQKSPLQEQEKKQFTDINFDAYAHYTTLPREYGVGAYTFSKKWIIF